MVKSEKEIEELKERIKEAKEVFIRPGQYDGFMKISKEQAMQAAHCGFELKLKGFRDGGIIKYKIVGLLTWAKRIILRLKQWRRL